MRIESASNEVRMRKSNAHSSNLFAPVLTSNESLPWHSTKGLTQWILLSEPGLWKIHTAEQGYIS
eukprot:1950676-Amphidinium_carterae.2